MLSKHYKPAPSEIVERFKFHSYCRKAGESVATFISELRSLAEFCNFEDTLEAMLRDWIVCGINDDVIQKRLLGESKLDYAKAVEIAMAMETAEQSMKELKGKKDGQASDELPREVHKTSADTPDRRADDVTALTCYRCGNKRHTATKCRVDKHVVCNKEGHMGWACPSKRKITSSNKTNNAESRTVGCVDDEEDEHDFEDSPFIHVSSCGVAHSPPIRVQVKLDECLVNMEVDTGASWKQIHHIHTAIHTASLQAVLAGYPAVFQKGLGTLKGYKAKIHVDPNAVPRFHRARSVHNSR